MTLPKEQLDLLYKELSFDEGKKLKVYKDTKSILTVGIGCNIIANDTTPIIGRKLKKVGEAITEKECIQLFNYTLQKVAIDPLFKNLPVLTSQLDPVRLRALINLCFNMGWETLNDFKNTLHFLQSKNYVQAASNLKKSKWYRDVRSRGDRIVYMVQYGKSHPDYQE
jgi:lysozyme